MSEAVAADHSKPTAVSLGSTLLITGFAIGSMFMELRLGARMPALATFLNCMMLLGFGILAFLVWKAWQGERWARLSCLILVVVRLLFVIVSFTSGADHAAFGGVLRLLPCAFEVAAMALFFSAGSNAWFRARLHTAGQGNDV